MHSVIPLIRQLLTVYWVLATTAILLKSFVPMFRVSLTYGKLHKTVTNEPVLWSFPLNKYATIPIFSPALAWRSFYMCGVATWFTCLYLKRSNKCLCEWLLCFQLVRRLLECFFLHRFSPGRRVTLLQLAAGLSFYVAAPITLMVASNQQCGVANQWIQNSAVLLFSVASVIQCEAHRELARVTPVVGKYGVPGGVCFRLIACPHYFAEVLIYFALHFLVNDRLTSLMAAFVVCNLTDSAIRTLRWYKETFPATVALPFRWSVIPYLL